MNEYSPNKENLLLLNKNAIKNVQSKHLFVQVSKIIWPVLYFIMRNRNPRMTDFYIKHNTTDWLEDWNNGWTESTSELLSPGKIIKTGLSTRTQLMLDLCFTKGIIKKWGQTLWPESSIKQMCMDSEKEKEH